MVCGGDGGGGGGNGSGDCGDDEDDDGGNGSGDCGDGAGDDGGTTTATAAMAKAAAVATTLDSCHLHCFRKSNVQSSFVSMDFVSPKARTLGMR